MSKRVVGLGCVGLAVAVVIGACGDDDADSTPANADADGGAPDTSTTDVKPAPLDTSVRDTAVPLECEPESVASFTPVWKPPVGGHLKKCTGAQIAQVSKCVWDSPGRDADACKVFLNASENAECVLCAYTPSANPQLGAVVSNGKSVQVNYAGCIALTTNDVTPTGCGAKVQAASLCQDAACVTSCSNASLQGLVACGEEAGKTVCSSHEDAAACGGAVLGDGGPASLCNTPNVDFTTLVSIYTNLFCGGLDSDAGTPDAATDAPTDG